MRTLRPTGYKRFLRSPPLIIGEVLALALAGVLGASLPQVDTAARETYTRFWGSGEWRGLGVGLGLDHVFQSAWFLAVLLLATASLVVVLLEQVRSLRAQVGRQLGEGHFRNAPFQATFERSSQGSCREPRTEIHSQGRLGRFGSPLFHFGLLLVILAGALRALFGATAAVDLLEGERLPATSSAWGAQWPGPLAAPFGLRVPLMLERVSPVTYPNGQLQDLQVGVLAEGPDGPRPAVLGINRKTVFPGGRVFVDATFGPAALLAWSGPRGTMAREAVLLSRGPGGDFTGSTTGPGGLQLSLRSGLGPAGTHPSRADARIHRGEALLFSGPIPREGSISLPGGFSLTLESLPYWVRLHGTRDPALILALAGFMVSLGGAFILFTVIPVDTWVGITPEGTRESVHVAMRPARFTPLYREQFQRLVHDLGGPS